MITLVEHALDEVRPILAGSPLGDLDMAFSGQRLHIDKDFRHAVADIFMVDDSAVSGSHGNRGRHFADKLFARLVHANHGEIRIMGKLIDFLG
jgi:hypothetical protein